MNALPILAVRVCLVLAFLFISIACSVAFPSHTPTPAFTPTPAIFAEDTARAFLKAWSEADYNAMYTMLAPSRQETTTVEQFVARYKGIATEMTLKSVRATLQSAREEGNEAEAKYTATLETHLFGTLQYEYTMQLRREQGRWGVLWNPGLVIPHLASGGSVRFQRTVPARADIFDRKGRPLTQPQTLVVVEVVPAQMKNESAILNTLARLFNKSASAIKAMYSNSPGDWRTTIGTLTQDQVRANLDALNQPGIYIDRTQDVRTYPRGTLAAHTIGYVEQIDAEELARLQVRGYREGDLIGKSGLELWGEQYLAGQRGGKLVVLTPSGAITATLATAPVKPSQNLYTTIDIDLQAIVEKALSARTRMGAAVVLDVSNGNVLAIASVPTWDPNRLSQRMTPAEFRALINDPTAPLVNRVTQGAFPPGSVFKIVAFSAAIEKGVYTPNSTFNCPGYWDGLGQNYRKVCWIYTSTGKGHGTLSLSNALVQSCNVTFYQVGYKLYQTDPNLLPSFARAFGLGQVTGIELAESPGIVPDPSKGTFRAGDAVNMVIGQGDLLTTPLQIANIMAAIANGGTLYRPRLVTRVASLADGTEKVFPVEARGKLPLSATTLAALRQALARVTTDRDGTAYNAFRGAKVSVAGKTGTAEVFKAGEPHSWFAAYAPADNPKIAVVVIAEHGSEGSTTAAPIVREIVEGYFALPNK
ncbi:MAG: penicillin-binding protein 2 [Anaerolineae bacterium]|nr:penicillin-binding protein 2 [Anaerolineae bacterium]